MVSAVIIRNARSKERLRSRKYGHLAGGCLGIPCRMLEDLRFLGMQSMSRQGSAIHGPWRTDLGHHASRMRLVRQLRHLALFRLQFSWFLFF